MTERAVALSLSGLSKEFGGLRAVDGVSLTVGPREPPRGVLEAVGLAAKEGEAVRNLSHGEQRQLEIALALAGSPRLLLLDEPTAGLSPAESHAMTALLTKLDPAITLLVIEHDMDVAFALTDRITVLHYGKVVADGLSHEVKANALVQEIYLGAS